MNKTIRHLSSLVAATGLATLLATAAFGQTYDLRVSTVIGEEDPLFKGYQRFADAVMERTGGDLSVEVFPNGQLGQDEDLMEQALLGANVAFNTDAGRLGERVQEFGILLAPYVFDEPLQAAKLYASDLYKGWLKQLEEEHGLVVLSMSYFVGARNFMTKEPIETPADLNGLKIRTPGAPVWQETIRALGATPVALPWIETYPGIQQGVVDGCEAQATGAYSSRLHEVSPIITRTGHILLMNGPVVGATWFNSLPEDYQEILFEEAASAGAWETEQVIALEGDFQQKMVDEGATIVDVDVTPFKQAAQEAYAVLNLVDVKAQVDEILSAQ